MLSLVHAAEVVFRAEVETRERDNARRRAIRERRESIAAEARTELCASDIR